MQPINLEFRMYERDNPCHNLPAVVEAVGVR